MLLKISRFFTREINAGKAAELGKGSMKRIELNGDKNALVVYNTDGTFHATGGKCSHYGAPLAFGSLVQGKIFCPWHCACFDIKTGHKITSPGLQNIPTYSTSVNHDGDVIVKIPNRVTDPAGYVDGDLSTWNVHNKQRFVIIGGGAAGFACAETLRINHFTGEIIMITKEDITPYDRVSLSKNFKMDALKTVLKSDEFYRKYGIQVKKNSTVTALDDKTKTIVFGNSETMNFTKVLIATGSTARIPKPLISASSLSNVCSIRNVSDHLKAKPLVESSKNIVIIGGSFLGLEAAYSIKSAYPDKSVTIIELESIPLQRIMGPQIGTLLLKQAELKGISFVLGKSADSINSESDKVASISINNTTLPCDFLLLATGAQINTSFIPEKLLNKDGSVRVSGLMQTDNPDIYAAGDIASFPSIHTGNPSRIEHWAVAQDQGINAALNMLGKGQYYTEVPFFWSNQAINIGFIGVHGEIGFNESKNVGTNDEGHLTYFFNGQKAVGVAIGNWPGASVIFKVMLERGLLPTKEQFENGKRFKDIQEDFKHL